MRSGRGENTQPERFLRPSMQRVELPAPWMCAPQRFRNAAKSAISGSRAAPRSTVVPLAQAAASTSVSVAPTLGKRRMISAPCRPDGACLPLHRPHLAQPGQMQVDGPRPDVAPAGQARLGTAQLCQQRRTEEDGRPHLFGSLPRKAAVLWGTRDKDILPFPPGRTACAPQKRQARRHIRKARHGPQAHIAAEHRRRKQRQHAVFRRRDAHCTVQRAAAHHHDPVFHKCSPHFAKDTPRYAK